MKEMLNYYGYDTLEEFGRAFGYFNNKDAERCLIEMYEEDTAPVQK